MNYMDLSVRYDSVNARLREYVEQLGLRFLDEPAKHGVSPAEYRRDEQCVRMATYLHGYDRLWVLLHELGHHLSGASDEELIEGDLGVTEAVADFIAIGVLDKMRLPTWGVRQHLDSVMAGYPKAEGTEVRHRRLIAAAVRELWDVVRQEWCRGSESN